LIVIMPPDIAISLEQIDIIYRARAQAVGGARDSGPARAGDYHAVSQATLAVHEGEFVSIVGPTGCGKSTLLNAAAGLLQPANGDVSIYGKPLEGLNAQAGYLFQQDALMPWKTALENVAIGLEVAGIETATARDKAEHWLVQVGLKGFGARYPHQLSGGMSQRVAIAMAIAGEPKLLIADEPTTALDVTIQAQIMDLLLALQKEQNMGLVLITHDLAVVAETAQRVCVMYAGQAVELGQVPALFDAPSHPYTEALLKAIPEHSAGAQRLATLPGIVPGRYDRPQGCLLSPRCPYVQPRCRDQRPTLDAHERGAARCFFPLVPTAEVA
jgi:dipeptide transport system ATP-binding protein